MWNQRTQAIRFTQAQRRAVADLLPTSTERLKLAEKNACTISFRTNGLTTIREKAEAARPCADNGMKRNSLRHVVDATSKALEEAGSIGSISTSQRLSHHSTPAVNSATKK